MEERWNITICFTIKAEDEVEAEDIIKQIIAEGMLTTEMTDEIEAFDVIDTEPAELP